jgi:hypothetical protein
LSNRRRRHFIETSQSRGLTQIKTALVDVRESLPIFLGSIGRENFDDDQAT